METAVPEPAGAPCLQARQNTPTSPLPQTPGRCDDVTPSWDPIFSA